MSYIAVVKYDSATKSCQCVTLTDYFEPNGGLVIGIDTLAKYAYENSLKPINFSIGRKCETVMDCGDFKRFSKMGSAVVLAELRTRGGRTVGYKLLSCNQGVVTNLKTEDIVERDNSYGNNEHFIQNGIIRNNTVNCYPRHAYPVIPINTKATSKSTKSKKTEEVAKTKPKTKAPVKKMDEKQLSEVDKCKKNGVDPSIISNPDLNPQQMRVLWVSKSKGALAEEFNDPRLSSDAMKFYADRLYDKQTVKDCGLMLEHPELGVDELGELYQCACDGMDYQGLIGESATDIYIAREKNSREYWGSSKLFDTDYYQKAMNVAMKMKGF